MAHSFRPIVLALGLSFFLGSTTALAAPDGVAGPYLAAQQAERRGDIAEAARLYTKTLARDRENVVLLERAMMHQIAAGRVSEGITLAKRLEASQPGHHLGVLALAAELLAKDEAGKARDLFTTEGAETGPFVAQIMNAWAAYDDGDQDTARDLLTALEQSDENGQAGQIVAVYHLGLLEAATGQDEAAVAALERAADLSEGGTLRLARLRAEALARLGRTDEAVAVIEERLEGTYGDERLTRLAADIADGKQPGPLVTTGAEGSAEVLFGVSGLLARGRNRLIALAYSRIAVYLNPDLVEARLLIGEVLDQDEQYDLAIAAFESIPDDVPEAQTARIAKAEALNDAGETDQAVAELEAVVASFPNSLDARTTLGDILRRKERYEEAAIAYDGAVDLIGEPARQHWVLFYQRGIAFERAKVWEKAEADFRTALELEPDQPLVLNYLGYSWVEQGQNLGEAERMIEKAVEQRPEDGYIVDSLGWVLYRLGDFNRAVEHLERAVELRPVDPVINDHFGDALWMVGRKIEAEFQWKRALSFEPEEKEAKRIRRKLEIGLDDVLAEEEAAGKPAIIGRQSTDENEATQQDGG